MKSKIIFALIILLATITRFYQLGSNPPSLYWDEVALGYNAYSIAQTAKDETGEFLPTRYFQSFGDYKPPVYIYSAVPGIAIFGLSEWSTRLPSALAGVGAVILTFFLTKLLIDKAQSKQSKPLLNNFLQHPNTQPDNNQNDQTKLNSTHIALLASFLLAISPWHMQISRVAYEANVGTFLTILTIYTFLRGVYYSGAWFIISSISAVLTLYTFNSNRVFTPLIITTLAVIYLKQILAHKKKLIYIIISATIGLILLSPLLPHITSKEGQLRYKEVNIFSNPEPVEIANQRIARADGAWWAKIFNNRRIYYAQDWLSGYFSHYTGEFLFISGDVNPRFTSGDTGQLYLIYLPFLLYGVYKLIIANKKEYYFIIIWILLAPVPSAFAREVPHALRTLHILPTYDIIASFGFFAMLSSLQNSNNSHKKIKTNALIAFSLILLLGQAFYFTYNYYCYYPQEFHKEWQYGYKQMVQELVKIQDNYDRIIITDALGRTYINIAFYQSYPPVQLQQLRQAKTDDLGFGFVDVTGFDKYEFRGIDWKREISGLDAKQTGIVVCIPAECEIGKFTKSVINGLDEQPVFIINEIPKGVDAWTELGIFRNEQ
jgi:4-amino-4-deoxy-L-arabinose transferase-like glycosyltransferase